MAKNEHGSRNAFNITKPARYRCQVLHYHRKLSRLYLSVYPGQRDEPAFYLLFADVAYIDAPMSWLGAEFNIAARDECIALMLEIGLVGEAIHQFPEAYAPITEYARLYRVHSVHCEIRIIASSGSILRAIPGDIQ